MVDKICEHLTNRIKNSLPDVDDEKAEIINYGLQNIIGEIPKNFIVLLIAYLLGVFELTLISLLILIPYRAVSGGFHLKTHIGCIVGTSSFYCGIALLSKYIVMNPTTKYLIAFAIWIFSMLMIKLYAPADTENVPILRKEDRKRKQILSYIIATISLIIAIIIPNQIISNIIIFGTLFQTITITKFAYKLTNNKYGYEIYEKQETTNIAWYKILSRQISYVI